MNNPTTVERKFERHQDFTLNFDGPAHIVF